MLLIVQNMTCVFLASQSAPNRIDFSPVYFSPLLMVASAILLIVLVVAGIFLWRSLATETKDFSGRYRERVENNSLDDNENAPIEDLKTVPERASADTINIENEPLAKEFQLNSQATVDATSDASVSSDDDQDLLDGDGAFSSQPTVDSTGDASVTSDEEE